MAQLMRRGGLMREKKITSDQVDARIAALRQQARDNDAANRAKAATGKAGETLTEVGRGPSSDTRVQGPLLAGPPDEYPRF